MTWTEQTSPTSINWNYYWFDEGISDLSRRIDKLEEATLRMWMGFVGYEKRVITKQRFETRRIEKHNWRSGEPERFRVAR